VREVGASYKLTRQATYNRQMQERGLLRLPPVLQQFGNFIG